MNTRSSGRSAPGKTSSAPKPSTSKPSGVSGPSPLVGENRNVRRSMDAELRRLRSMFRETVQAYATKVEGQIAHLQEVMEENGGQGDRETAMIEMLTFIRQLKLKPEKGRKKDLREIHGTVQHIRQLTQSW